MSSLENGDCHLIVAVEVNQLLSEMLGPRLDDGHSIYCLPMADRMISHEEVNRELDVVDTCVPMMAHSQCHTHQQTS